MNTRAIILAILLFLVCKATNGQDVHFSSLMASDMYLNPAKTGFFATDFKVGGAYRNQWQTVSGRGYNTALITAEARLFSSRRKRHSFALGIGYAHDVAGSLKFGQRQLIGSIAYNKQLSKRKAHFVAVGLNVESTTWGFDPSRADFGSSSSSYEGVLLKETSTLSIGAGVHWMLAPSEETAISAGFCASHLNAPSYSFFDNKAIRLSRRYTAYASCLFATSEQTSMNVISKCAFQNDNYELILGAEYLYNFAMTMYDNEALGVGLFYRTGDALVATLRYSHDSFSVGLCYDVNLSSLAKVSSTYGAIELWASYGLNITNHKYKTKTIPCPTF